MAFGRLAAVSAATPVTSPSPAPRRYVQDRTLDGEYAPKRAFTEDVVELSYGAGDPWSAGRMVAVTRPEDAVWPVTAEALMRSRFEAFRTGDAAWLLASWHPSTRPEGLDLTDNPTWRGLQIVETVEGGASDDTGIVEFRATYLRPGGGVDSQHERSRFVRWDGRWFYLDAV